MLQFYPSVSLIHSNSWLNDQHELEEFIDNVLQEIDSEQGLKNNLKSNPSESSFNNKKRLNPPIPLSMSVTHEAKEMLVSNETVQAIHSEMKNIRFSDDKLKKINQTCKNIVSGYMRHIQDLIFNITEFPYIFTICLMYYSDSEYFTTIGQDISVYDYNKVLSSYALDMSYCYYGDGTSYGNIPINNNSALKYIWTFKLFTMDQSIVAIGIDSSNKLHTNNAFYDCDNKQPYYAVEMISIGGCSFKYCMDMPQIQYGQSINDCDEIKMELNVKCRTLKFYINDCDQGIAFDDIDFKNDIQYYMAVYSWKVPRITLTGFYPVFVE
eukprot:436109_1